MAVACPTFLHPQPRVNYFLLCRVAELTVHKQVTASPAPTDPDVRNSRFRFFPEWLRTIPTAIRARLVDRSLRPQCATPVSRARSHFRGIPLSYSWAFPDQDFPAFDRYYEDATTSQTSQRRSRLTRPPVPAIDCTVRSSPAAVAQATPGCCSAGSSVPALFSAASFGISRVSVEPVAGTPCSQTPAEP